MGLCVCAFVRLCVCASVRLCVCASVRACVGGKVRTWVPANRGNIAGAQCAVFFRCRAEGLGPARPAVLALTTALQTYTWWLVLTNNWRRSPAAASTLMVASLSFLPEALDYMTRRASLTKPAPARPAGSNESGSGEIPTVNGSTGNAEQRATASSLVTLKMEMGCVSCVKAVLDQVRKRTPVQQLKRTREREI